MEALESIFADAGSPQESLSGWKRKVAQFPWWAEDALYCIEAVLYESDEELQKIAAKARLTLRGQFPREWLRTRLAELQAAFHEEVRIQQERRSPSA